MKKISVIIPAYLPNENYFKFLERAVYSVINQSIKNINLVVVFNGPFVKTINGATNIVLNYKTSASVARNIGASFAYDSDYFAFLDADDFYHELKLEKQLDCAIKNNIDFLFTEANRVDSNGNLLAPYTFIQNAFDHEEIKNRILEENILITSSCFIKKESFFKCGMFPATNEYNITGNQKHHNERGVIYEDYLMWYTAICKNYVFKKINEHLTFFRINTSVER